MRVNEQYRKLGFIILFYSLFMFLAVMITANTNKIAICHQPKQSNGKSVTILVDDNSVGIANAHLQHGDYLGACIDNGFDGNDGNHSPNEPKENELDGPIGLN